MGRAAMLVVTALALGACASASSPSFYVPASFEGAAITDMRAAYGAPAASEPSEAGGGVDVFLRAMSQPRRLEPSAPRPVNVGAPVQDDVGPSRNGAPHLPGARPDRLVCEFAAAYDAAGVVTAVRVEPARCGRLDGTRPISAAAADRRLP